MVEQDNTDSIISTANKIDPTEFDVTVSALLIGAGAEKFIKIFKRKNIGQSTLTELADEDLLKLGVDDQELRQRILDEIKNLPLYEELPVSRPENNLGAMEIIDILEDSSQHLYRIYLSMLANTLALKKANKVSDYLLHKEKYASDISLSTLSEITNILNSMDIALHTQFKVLLKEKSNKKTKEAY
ncbi:uncharacterized protein LOC115443139 [Manduca sexta]|uniref:uncharacterized protein LOC115443139 n=1 Tax=Manduca sexta TaxID=7130 RepID=UPI00188E7BC5|nr:uncharacterized protein LOC115443139 [Manduca sexta]